ncbi:sigma-70 family RNA polymerase sigma factor [Pseudoxanthomonas sp. 3HH-4]|uniref:RNA polymerase sigma factor n=1 Tax=Pseudoxanthomonas sp. 3HH-4 TaxID=1690214 RepID=UPI001C88F733|nr:sigma-70 family RNA polymerase sigma factor [Pseudoxanthomonas sp. 3HH-4]
MKRRAIWLSQNVLPHEPALRAWLIRHVRDHASVDDVIQECYALLMSMEDVDHIQHARSYLFTAAKSVVLQSLRRAKVVQIESVGEIERLDVADDNPSPESHASAVQEMRYLEHCIGQLPTKCRRVFLLRKMQGMPQRDIARELGISENTVEKHMVKALKYLAQALAVGGSSDGGARKRRQEKKEAIHEE